MVSRLGTETSPSSGASSPTIMRKRVVLPEPFGPTRPTFSPGFNWNEASTNSSCLPYCLWIFEKEINTQASVLSRKFATWSGQPTAAGDKIAGATGLHLRRPPGLLPEEAQ